MKITQSQLGAVLSAGRRTPESTELSLELAGVEVPYFWIELWNLDTHLGYGRFDMHPDYPGSAATTRSFVLTALLPAHSPAPSPTASLSGVLWNRRAALEASSEPPFSEIEEDWIVKRRMQSGLGGFLRGA